MPGHKAPLDFAAAQARLVAAAESVTERAHALQQHAPAVAHGPYASADADPTPRPRADASDREMGAEPRPARAADPFALLEIHRLEREGFERDRAPEIARLLRDRPDLGETEARALAWEACRGDRWRPYAEMLAWIDQVRPRPTEAAGPAVLKARAARGGPPRNSSSDTVTVERIVDAIMERREEGPHGAWAWPSQQTVADVFGCTDRRIRQVLHDHKPEALNWAAARRLAEARLSEKLR